MRARLSSVFVLGWFTLLAFSPLGFAAQTYRLQNVRVTGSHRFAEADLVASLGLKPGMTVDVDALKQAADRLMATGALASLEYKYTPLSSGLRVEYTVTDGMDFLPCRYDNLVWMTPEALTAAAHEKVPLYNGEAPTSGELLDQVALALSQALVKVGVVSKVRYELHTRGMNGPVDAILFVSDTLTPKIKDITLTGAGLLTPQERTEATKRLVGDEYGTTRVQDALSSGLFFVYGNKGYLRVKVGQPEPSLVGNPLDALVSVAVPVDEGAQYRLRSINWSGNAAIPTAQLVKEMPLHAGEVADHSKLDAGLQAVQKNYKAKGYLNAKLRREPAFDDREHTVTYNITVEEGDQFRMGGLHMTGLDPLVLDELQKKWKLQRGEAYDGDYVQSFLHDNSALINGNGQARTIKILQSPTPEKTVDVSITF